MTPCIHDLPAGSTDLLHCPRRDLRRRAEAARLDLDQGKKHQYEPRFEAHPDVFVQHTDGGWAGENFIANDIE
jgi:hypothetical protein